MSARILWLAGAATAVASSGCGTVCNTVWLNPLEGGQKAFGGVKLDAAFIASSATGKANSYDGEPLSRPPLKRAMHVLFFGIDLPLSIIGDTITLPYTLNTEVTNDLNNYYFPKKAPATELPADHSEKETQ